jgi:hypothetical protein
MYIKQREDSAFWIKEGDYMVIVVQNKDMCALLQTYT